MTPSSDAAISFTSQEMNNPQPGLDEDDFQDSRNGIQKKWRGNAQST